MSTTTATLLKRAGSPSSNVHVLSSVLFPLSVATPCSSPARNHAATAVTTTTTTTSMNTFQNPSLIRRRSIFHSTKSSKPSSSPAASYFFSSLRLSSSFSSDQGPKIGMERLLVQRDDPHHHWVKRFLSAKPPTASSSAPRSFSSSDLVSVTAGPIAHKSNVKKRSASSSSTPTTNVKDFFFQPKIGPGRNISPQLAHVWEDHHQKYDIVAPGPEAPLYQHVAFEESKQFQAPDEGLMASLKLDGVRATFQLKSTKGMNVPIRIWRNSQKRIVALSRHHKEFFSVARIATALEPLFDKYPELILDGEMYIHGVDFNELSGAIRSQEAIIKNSGVSSSDDDDDTIKNAAAQAVRRAKAMQQALQFHIFDIAYHANLDVARMDYTERMMMLKRILRATIDPKILAIPPRAVAEHFDDRTSRIAAFRQLVSGFEEAANDAEKIIVVVDSVRIKKEDVERCRSIVSNKVEGLMIRHPRSPYTYGRSANLLKVKKMQDAEYKIVGFTEGKARLKGHLGALILQTNDGKKKFKATLSAPDTVKRGIWLTRSKYQGHWATVQFQDISAHGIPRFPVAKTIRGKSKKDFV